jgi:hypothetical protein
MGELEDKLNSILSSPEEMEKIMGIARSLREGANETETPRSAETPSIDPSALTGGIDPKMLGVMTRLMGGMNQRSNEKTAILRSIKPFLKKERREKLDRASELARMAKLAKTALNDLPGGDPGV